MRRSIRGKMILFIGLPAAAVFVTAMLWILSFAEKQARRIREAEMAEHAASFAARFDEYFGKAARVADTTARFIAVVPDLREQQIFGLLRGTVRINRRIYGAAMAFEPGSFKEDDSLFCPWSLSKVENSQLADRFLKTHRRYLVNPVHIKGLKKVGDQLFCYVGKATELEVPVSRSRAKDLRALLGV